MISEKFIVVSILLNVYGSLIYIIGTLKGKTRPNRVTWFMVSVIAMIIFIAMLAENASITSSLITLVLALLTTAIFISSFVNKEASWRITTFDVFCGLLSLVGIIAWLISGDGNLAILFSLAANFMAFLPTIIKSLMNPQTENSLAFFCGAVGALITLLTIKTWDFASIAFPIYVLIVNLTTSIIIKFEIGTKYKILTYRV